jgi:hypothetical protein
MIDPNRNQKKAAGANGRKGWECWNSLGMVGMGCSSLLAEQLQKADSHFPI